MFLLKNLHGNTLRNKKQIQYSAQKSDDEDKRYTITHRACKPNPSTLRAAPNQQTSFGSGVVSS